MATDKPLIRVLSSLGSAAATSGIYLAVKYLLTGGLTTRTLWIAGIIAVVIGVISALPSRPQPSETDANSPTTDDLRGSG